MTDEENECDVVLTAPAKKDVVKCTNWSTYYSLQLLHPNVRFIVVQKLKLTEIKWLPETLESLVCSNNELQGLPIMPVGLKYLDCSKNKLKIIPAATLPEGLSALKCGNNKITALPHILPPGLAHLYCANNALERLPAWLPPTLRHLNCGHNRLTDLPLWTRGNDALAHLICENNQILELPSMLPPALRVLKCGHNRLTGLPLRLPATLTQLHCENNKIDRLPAWLPCGLRELNCEHNLLGEIPAVPLGLQKLWLTDNPLYVWPDLPDGLIMFHYDPYKDEAVKYYRPMFQRVATTIRRDWYSPIFYQNPRDKNNLRLIIDAVNNMNERFAVVRCNTRMQVINKGGAIAEAYWKRMMHPSRLQPLLEDETLEVDDFMEEHVKWL